MRSLSVLLLMALISQGTLRAQDHDPALELLSPLYSDINLPNDDRLIEPTSPVVGKELTAQLKRDQRHPEVILKELKERYPGLNRDLQISSMAYFKTVVGPLRDYCSTVQKEEADDKRIEQVELAAIPLPALRPMHASYKLNLASLREEYVTADNESLEQMARRTAMDYQQERYDCNVVKQLDKLEAKVKKYFPRRWDRLVDLHHKISSPEAAYPRIQFSINGFTQYVFNEIMKLPYERLAGLLKVTYEAQVEWIRLKDEGEELKTRYLAYAEEAALKHGFLPRESLLALTYSNRNMPSIDVHYGFDTDKALLLETYFWKFRDHRNYVQKKYEKELFPNKVMKQNPGVYHYLTSALMACDIRLHGYSGLMARLLALGNKIGYKVHKLLGEIAGKDGKKPRFKEIKATAKKQGFGPGVDAGKYGGSHGVKFCRKHTPKEHWLKNRKESAPEDSELAEPSELDDEEIPEELKELLE